VISDFSLSEDCFETESGEIESVFPFCAVRHFSSVLIANVSGVSAALGIFYFSHMMSTVS